MVFQPDFDDQRFCFNPYALGFAMMQDIERIVSDPTEEEIVSGFGHCRDRRRDGGAARCLGQLPRRKLHQPFLSPRLIRHLRLFHLHDDPAVSAGIRVDAIHDERGYRRGVRRELARQYDVGLIDPDRGSMSIRGQSPPDAAPCGLDRAQLQRGVDTRRVAAPCTSLRHDVSLVEVDGTDTVLKEYVVNSAWSFCRGGLEIGDATQ